MTAWDSAAGAAARWPEPHPWHDLDHQEAVYQAVQELVRAAREGRQA